MLKMFIPYVPSVIRYRLRYCITRVLSYVLTGSATYRNYANRVVLFSIGGNNASCNFESFKRRTTNRSLWRLILNYSSYFQTFRFLLLQVILACLKNYSYLQMSKNLQNYFYLYWSIINNYSRVIYILDALWKYIKLQLDNNTFILK